MIDLIFISFIHIFTLIVIFYITLKKYNNCNLIYSLITLSILFLISITINLYIIFKDNSNIFIIVNNMFSIISFFIMIVYSFKKSIELEKNKGSLISQENSYKSLSDSYETLREFKHDFANILQAIGGYIYSSDLNGLKKYYSSLLKDYSKLNILTLFNNNIINSPPVLALLSEKHKKAESLGITFNVEIYFDFNTIKMDVYEFTRILGIFLDNSIEAATNSNDKIINIIIRKDMRYSRDLIIIENSYSDDKINIDKIFEKNFSTKKGNSGIGLCKVRKILKKYNNVFLNTSVNKKLFTQQLEIY